MQPSDDRKPTEGPRPEDMPKTPRKRFRIERLEERVAPRKGGNGTNNCPGGSISGSSTSSGSFF